MRALLIVILTALSLVATAQEQINNKENSTGHQVDIPTVEELTEYIKSELIKDAENTSHQTFNSSWLSRAKSDCEEHEEYYNSSDEAKALFDFSFLPIPTCYLPDQIPVGVLSIREFESALNLEKHVLFYATTIERHLAHSLLPSDWTRGLFFTDGSTIGYLSGSKESKIRSIQSILLNEQFEFENADPATLTEFFSSFICEGNCSIEVISHESQLFKQGYTISYPRDKLGLIRDLQVMLQGLNVLNLNKGQQAFLQSRIEGSLRRVDYAVWDKMISAESAEQYKTDLIAFSNGATIIDENPVLPYEITPPSLNQAENGDWILEFISLIGWMHETNTLTLQRITFSSEFEITLEQELITDTVYAKMPEIMY